jgi:plasmid segregation protein ParM
LEVTVQIIGVDLGFGFTKATDGVDSAVFKSVIGEATEQRFAGGLLNTPAVVEGAGGNDPYLHLELQDRGVFVGELAERQSNVRSFTLDPGRFVEDSSYVLTMAALSLLAKPNTGINLVAALPISDYSDRAERLASILQGRHIVDVVEPAGRRQRRLFEVDEVRVIPEPFGSMYHLLLNDDGTLADRPLSEEKIGIIDVGFQTVDLTVSDRTAFLERASRSSDAGVARAFTVIAAKLREKSGVHVELYRLYDAVQTGRIKIRGDAYDLERLTEHVFTQLSADIAAQANELWADEWDMDRILLTGGGGAVLAPYLIPMLHGRAEVVEDEDARFNNVRGFAKYGRHVWSQVAPAAEPSGHASPY